MNIIQLEDDPHLATILRVAIQTVQPDVHFIQFWNSDDLLSHLSKPGIEVDTLVLDIRVPGRLNGLQLAYEIRQQGFKGQMLLSSAYAPPERRLLAVLRSEFVPKPWDLRSMVNRVLRRAADSTITAGPRQLIPEQASHLAVTSDIPFEPAALLLERLLGVTSMVAILNDQADCVEQWLTKMVLPEGEWRSRLEWAAVQAVTQGQVVREQLENHHIIALPFVRQPVALLAIKSRGWQSTELPAFQAVVDLLVDYVAMKRKVNHLTETNAELNNFTSIVAHDLKTPLASIIAYADLVKMLLGNPSSDIDGYLTAIGDTAHTLTDMTSDLLWLARLDNPGQAIQPVDTRLVLDEALKRLHYPIALRGMAVQVEGNVPPVMGIEIWVEEIFANLISNAVKYIGDDNPAPRLSISAITEGRYARFEIADNGVGIAPEHIPRLFRERVRLKTVEAEGTGLGLTLIHRIITRLGGQAGVYSQEGVGSTFWFMLPLAD